MRGLTVVLGEAAADRLRTALVLLLATNALGGRARLFLEGPAVALLATPITSEADSLWQEALSTGVEVMLCQSGLATAGLDAGALDPRLACGGPLLLLQTLGDDRLALA